MPIAFTLLRSAHATGTHHQLALDALAAMTGPSAEAWQRLMYGNLSVFLDGSKAPDTAFKDFENHVLHPRHGFWGGAIGQAETWYGELVAALKRQDWPASAYAAGVLSHYLSDPLMPLHTHQTDAESNIHAGVEWTIRKTYADLYALGQNHPIQFESAPGADWIASSLKAGATRATSHYETILAHYDIKRGVVAPEEGLNKVGQRAIAEMITEAVRLIALAFDKALAEAATPLPEVSLASAAFAALASKPRVFWHRRTLDTIERRQIEAMYDELVATGSVTKNMPESERRIRALFAAHLATLEKGTTIVQPVAAENALPARVLPTLDSIDTSATPKSEFDPEEDPVEAADQVPRQPGIRIEAPRPAPPHVEPPAARVRMDLIHNLQAEAAAAMAVNGDPSSADAVKANVTETAPAALSSYRPSARPAGVRHLTLEQDVVHAPSIGPKTAARLQATGIASVADLLAADPGAIAKQLASAYLTEAVVMEWQDQTRLMVHVPELRATQARLLVGAGYRTVDAIADADADQLCADLLKFALTPEGQRTLRDGHAPDIDLVRMWCSNARATKAA